MIPVAKPSLKGNESKYLQEAIVEGEVSHHGRFVRQFEEKFAEYIGTKYAVSCTSGTTGLQLALAAAGVKQGDIVLVPEFTMIATAWAATYQRAEPVFVDCGDDLNIDFLKLTKLGDAAKAVIPVHVYGRPCNIKSIVELAAEDNMVVIEDCAEAHGAYVKNYITKETKKVGSFGHMGVFSLFGNKIITSGEGGVITTNDKSLYDRLIYLRSMSFDPDHSFLHNEQGFNYRMSNLQAAVALAQLEQIDEFLEKRAEIQEWYDKWLGGYTVERKEGSVLWYYDVILPNKTEAVIKKLSENDIDSRRFFKPMSMQPQYGGKILPTKAQYYSEHGLYLPTFVGLDKKTVEYICKVLISCL